MKKYLFFIAILLSIKTFAQDNKHISLAQEEKFKQRVKIIDEFTKRFNCQTNYEGKPIPKDSVEQMRERFIFRLIDEDFAVKPAELDNMKEFIKTVTGKTGNKPVFLDYFDKEWYAETLCEVKYKGKLEQIKIVLGTDINSQKISKWAILSVDAPFLDITAKDTTATLSPISHDLNFGKLIQAIKDNKENIAAYTPYGYQPDNRPVFFHLVKTGQLEMTDVKSITYHFLQVPGWKFEVKHFERPNQNVGWLISNMNKMSDADKLIYKKSILKLSK